MKTTSEFVSVGHPDRVCDYISSYVLDRHLEADPKTRYAVEVQMKDNFVTLAGEVTSAAKFTRAQLDQFVREAVAEIGYTAAYQRKWGEDNAPCADKLAIAWHLSQQSPDIAQGVDNAGWGDQGIFWGMACNSPATDNQPLDHWYARKIGEKLYALAKERGVIGLDIKTQVTLNDGVVASVIIAAPCLKRDFADFELDAAQLVRRIVGRRVKHIVVNGTGAYVRHGSMGDCGTTGRKLAVDFYGGNCRVGGGSPWTKDGTKADVALNIYARHKAVEAMYKYGQPLCYCAIDCCIGRREIGIVVLDAQHNEIASWQENFAPQEIIAKLGLDKPCYAHKCRCGLFA